MKRLRLATSEEIDSIRNNSDLGPGCSVLALDTQAGTALAVIRQCVEVNPVHFPPDFPDRMKLFFMRDIETFLSAQGVLAYYFMIHADDTQWLEVIKNYGAEVVSTAPEIRHKVTL